MAATVAAAAGGDLALPEIEGTPPLSTRLLNGYMDRLLTATEYDTAAFEQFLKVAWLCRRTDSAAAPLDDVACRRSQPTPAQTPDTD